MGHIFLFRTPNFEGNDEVVKLFSSEKEGTAREQKQKERKEQNKSCFVKKKMKAEIVKHNIIIKNIHNHRSQWTNKSIRGERKKLSSKVNNEFDGSHKFAWDATEQIKKKPVLRTLGTK